MAEGSAVPVMHISTVHRAPDMRIYQRECVSLAEAGYDVTILAPHDRPEVRSGVKLEPLSRPRGRLARVLLLPARAFIAALRSRAKLCHLHDPELIPIGMLLRLAGK